MHTSIEFTVVLSGKNEIVYGELQKLFDAILEVEPCVLSLVDCDFRNTSFDCEVEK